MRDFREIKISWGDAPPHPYTYTAVHFGTRRGLCPPNISPTPFLPLPFLPPGPKGVTYVADNGKELFTHSYSSILRCCTATDRISFAYIFQSGSEQQFTCHVFQALTYVEVRIPTSPPVPLSMSPLTAPETLDRASELDCNA